MAMKMKAGEPALGAGATSSSRTRHLVCSQSWDFLYNRLDMTVQKLEVLRWSSRRQVWP